MSQHPRKNVPETGGNRPPRPGGRPPTPTDEELHGLPPDTPTNEETHGLSSDTPTDEETLGLLPARPTNEDTPRLLPVPPNERIHRLLPVPPNERTHRLLPPIPTEQPGSGQRRVSLSSSNQSPERAALSNRRASDTALVTLVKNQPQKHSLDSKVSQISKSTGHSEKHSSVKEARRNLPEGQKLVSTSGTAPNSQNLPLKKGSISSSSQSPHQATHSSRQSSDTVPATHVKKVPEQYSRDSKKSTRQSVQDRSSLQTDLQTSSVTSKKLVSKSRMAPNPQNLSLKKGSISSSSQSPYQATHSRRQPSDTASATHVKKVPKQYPLDSKKSTRQSAQDRSSLQTDSQISSNTSRKLVSKSGTTPVPKQCTLDSKKSTRQSAQDRSSLQTDSQISSNTSRKLLSKSGTTPRPQNLPLKKGSISSSSQSPHQDTHSRRQPSDTVPATHDVKKVSKQYSLDSKKSTGQSVQDRSSLQTGSQTSSNTSRLDDLSSVAMSALREAQKKAKRDETLWELLKRECEKEKLKKKWEKLKNHLLSESSTHRPKINRQVWPVEKSVEKCPTCGQPLPQPPIEDAPASLATPEPTPGTSSHHHEPSSHTHDSQKKMPAVVVQAPTPIEPPKSSFERPVVPYFEPLSQSLSSRLRMIAESSTGNEDATDLLLSLADERSRDHFVKMLSKSGRALACSLSTLNRSRSASFGSDDCPKPNKLKVRSKLSSPGSGGTSLLQSKSYDESEEERAVEELFLLMWDLVLQEFLFAAANISASSTPERSPSTPKKSPSTPRKSDSNNE